jgi:hypothetical protein
MREWCVQRRARRRLAEDQGEDAASRPMHGMLRRLMETSRRRSSTRRPPFTSARGWERSLY